MSTLELEHCEFIWTIRNYSFFPRTDTYYLISPTFRLGKSKSHWELSLTSVFDKLPTVYLSRSHDDEGPAQVEVKYHLTVKIDGKREVASAKFEETFERLCSRGMAIPKVDLEELLNSPGFFDADELVVTCEMFIFVQASSQRQLPLPPVNVHLQELSKDLKELFKSQKHCDVTFRTMNGEIHAHKCVLMARSEYFMSNLKWKYTETLEFTDVPKQAMEKLLWFMYSGEFELLDHDVQYFLPLFELINTFKISYLLELMAAKEIYANTEFEVERSEFTWLIRDFSLYETFAKAPVKSPCFTTAEEAWTFVIYPKGFEKQSEYIGLKIKATDLKRKVLAALEVSVRSADKSEESNRERDRRSVRIVTTLGKDKDFEFPNFLEKEYFECSRQSLTAYDTLTLDITLKLCPAIGLSIKSSLKDC